MTSPLLGMWPPGVLSTSFTCAKACDLLLCHVATHHFEQPLVEHHDDATRRAERQPAGCLVERWHTPVQRADALYTCSRRSDIQPQSRRAATRMFPRPYAPSLRCSSPRRRYACAASSRPNTRLGRRGWKRSIEKPVPVRCSVPPNQPAQANTTNDWIASHSGRGVRNPGTPGR
jgi:hypothetical protein